MNHPSPPLSNAQSSRDMQRCLELLADLEVSDLEAVDQDELRALLTEYPQIEADSMSYASAAAALALMDEAGESAALPRDLREKLESAADHVAVGVTPVHGRNVPPRHSFTQQIVRPTLTIRLGWYAAAACLGLAAAVWSGLFPSVPANHLPPTAEVIERATQTQEQIVQTPNEFRQRPDVLVMPWRAIQEPLASMGVHGEVVWSNTEQRGYGFFYGLPANDPATNQYQLWIFDKSRPAKFPVNGGVFNADFDPESDALIVTIDPELHVFDPVGFAVTREAPGGVVVSDQEMLLLMADR